MNPLADELALLHITDVHIFQSDGAAINLLQMVYDFLQSSRSGHPGFFGRAEFFSQVLLAKPKILDGQRWLKVPALAHGIGICKKMAAGAIGFN